MVGQREFMVVSREDLDNKDVINRIDNGSKLVFVSFTELLLEQSDLRALNIARKLSKKSTSAASQSLDLDSSTSTQTWIGIPRCLRE